MKIVSGQRIKAVELYNDKQVSLGLGAKMAGVSLGEFLDLLKLHSPDLNITKENVEDALKAAMKILKTKKE